MGECLKAVYQNLGGDIEKLIVETTRGLRETKEREKKARREKMKLEKAGKLDENSKKPNFFFLGE